MKPIRTEDTNAVLKLPGGTDENDLPCRVADGWTHSTWEMTTEERRDVLEQGGFVVWTWWGNLVGVSVKVGDSERAHTEVDMPTQHQYDPEDGTSIWSHVVTLDEEEALEVRAGAHIKLAVDMHPTCAVAVTTYQPEEAAAA